MPVTLRSYDQGFSWSKNAFSPPAQTSSSSRKSVTTSESARNAFLKNNSSKSKVVKPYIPSAGGAYGRSSYYSPHLRSSPSNRTRSTLGSVDFDDDQSFSSMSFRSRNNSLSIASGDADYFFSRRGSADPSSSQFMDLRSRAGLRMELEESSRNLLEKEHLFYSPKKPTAPIEKAINFHKDAPKLSRIVSDAPLNDDRDPFDFSYDEKKHEVNPIITFLNERAEERKRKREKEEQKLMETAKKISLAELSDERVQERSTSLRNLGKMGVALFCPLDAGFKDWYVDEDNNDNSFESEFVAKGRNVDGNVDTEEKVQDFELDDEPIISVEIVNESAESLDNYPVILSEAIREQIVRQGFPVTLMDHSWQRLFSVARDGDNFGTFLYLVQNYRFTLFSVKTTSGEVFGGFSDSEWEDHSQVGASKSFYGGGQCFLYSVSTNVNTEGDADAAQVKVFKWSGLNTYCQLCDHSSCRIAMGGGSGDFGICLEDSFYRGSTGYCDTYSNTPLGKETAFDILEFEIFGFTKPDYAQNDVEEVIVIEKDTRPKLFK